MILCVDMFLLSIIQLKFVPLFGQQIMKNNPKNLFKKNEITYCCSEMK